jgi:hypothetical protein
MADGFARSPLRIDDSKRRSLPRVRQDAVRILIGFDAWYVDSRGEKPFPEGYLVRLQVSQRLL